MRYWLILSVTLHAFYTNASVSAAAVKSIPTIHSAENKVFNPLSAAPYTVITDWVFEEAEEQKFLKEKKSSSYLYRHTIHSSALLFFHYYSALPPSGEIYKYGNAPSYIFLRVIRI